MPNQVTESHVRTVVKLALYKLISMIVTSIALGALGKFLTNFFKEDTTEKE